MTAILGAEEEVLWEGVPQKMGYIVGRLFFGSIGFVPFIVFFTLGAAVNLVEAMRTGDYGLLFLVAFLSLPLVLWLLNLTSLPRMWANEYYLATNQRVIIRSGHKNRFYTVFNNSDIRSATLVISPLARMLKVGNIHFYCGDDRAAYSESVTQTTRKAANNTDVFRAVNSLELFTKMQRIAYDSRMGNSYPQLPQLSPQPVFEYPQQPQPQLQPQPDGKSEPGKRIIDI
jgi:hypothetical protein